jgi:hypothetical protein
LVDLLDRLDVRNPRNSNRPHPKRDVRLERNARFNDTLNEDGWSLLKRFERIHAGFSIIQPSLKAGAIFAALPLASDRTRSDFSRRCCVVLAFAVLGKLSYSSS